MAWNDSMPLLLRYVVGDISTTPKYLDSDLENIILAAAQFIAFRVNFLQTYVIDPVNVTLTPDPTDPATIDEAFVTMTIYKAACMLLMTEVRLYGGQSISIRDGTSAIDLRRDLRGLTILANQFCNELEKAILNYIHNQGSYSLGIIAPYVWNVLGWVDRGGGYGYTYGVNRSRF